MKKRWWRWTLAILAATNCAFAQPQTPAAEFPGSKVLSVQVISDASSAPQENPGGLPLQAGDLYSEAAVRESLRALYRTGKYDDIQAFAIAEAGGVRVEFRARENYYVDTVRIFGLKSTQAESLTLSALRLRVGETFRQSELQEALVRLREALEALGYYKSDVKVQTIPHAATRQMDILLHTELGERAQVGSMVLRSAEKVDSPELLRRSKLKPGDRIRQDTLEQAAERVRKYLVKRGHLGARVVGRRGAFDAKTNTVPVTLEVFEGPTLAVRVEGAKISQRELRRLVPVYQEGAVDEDLLQEGRRNIRDFLEAEGFFDSQVTYATEDDPKEGRLMVKYTVNRGPRRRLVGVDFEGNKYFSKSLLTERLGERVARGLSRGRFSQRMLADDADSIRALYESNGFPKVQVEAELVEDYQGKEGDLFVRFRVTEGPQTRVAQLTLEGNSEIAAETLLEYVGSTKGQPYSTYNVESDRNNVLTIYFNEGFPDARFDFTAENGPAENRVNLTYHITEGRRVTVRQILYSGMEHTRLGTIRNQMRVEPGEPFRQGAIIESQRNLYNLGIFSRVQIAPQNAEGLEPEKTVVVNVEEARRYTIAYGGGFEVQRGGGSDPTGSAYRVSPRGVFEVSKANIGGRGHTLSLRARASTFQYRFSGSYLAPNFLAKPSLRFEIGGFAEKESDVRTFTARKYEGSAQLVQQLSPFTTIGYRYAYRRVLVDPATLKVDPLAIPLLSQPTNVSSFGVGWIRDHRDNPAEAQRGNFNSLDSSVASDALGGTGNFIRLLAQNSTFYPIGPLTLARSTRFGALQRFAGSIVTDIPLPERLYAGGGTSLRGFGFNQAGPRATTGFPIGGEVMIIFNQEIRFPMKVPYIKGKVGGGVFYDAGNIFSQISNVTLRSQPRPIPLGLGDFFSHTVGVSFRYSTPIGPVRLDFGYLLNNVRFNFQENSTSPVQAARLPRFQFFFNIGSMF